LPEQLTEDEKALYESLKPIDHIFVIIEIIRKLKWEPERLADTFISLTDKHMCAMSIGVIDKFPWGAQSLSELTDAQFYQLKAGAESLKLDEHKYITRKIFLMELGGSRRAGVKDLETRYYHKFMKRINKTTRYRYTLVRGISVTNR
jgi:hypothetical protein